MVKFNGGEKLHLEMFVCSLTEEKMGVSETVGISLLCYLVPWCGMIKLHISRLLGDRQPIS